MSLATAISLAGATIVAITLMPDLFARVTRRLCSYLACRERGHDWGQRRMWGDAGQYGTHKCSRCGKWGWPTTGGTT